MKPLTKIKGALKLSAIGDALGWITEFEKSKKSIVEKYGQPEINDFQEWEKRVGGRFWGHIEKIEHGAYSDDTQLIISVARSLQDDGTVNHEYFSKVELPSWLNYARGAGRTIKLSSRKIQRKSVKWYDNFYTIKKKNNNFEYTDTGANGSAMRVLPIALANIGNEKRIFNEIFANAIVTHGHPRAIIGAILYGHCINKAIIYRIEDFNSLQYLVELGNSCKKLLSIGNVDRPEIKQWANKWTRETGINFITPYNETIEEVLAYLRILYTQINAKYPESDKEILNKLGCYNPKTKGSGISTVIGGIYLALKYIDEPKKGIIKTVNLIGTDTDSIASFVGGILGSVHGQNVIPNKWKEVQDYEYFDLISERIYNIGFEDKSEPKTTWHREADLKLNTVTLDALKSQKYKTEDTIHYLPLGKGKIQEKNVVDSFKEGKKSVIYKVKFIEGQLCTFSFLIDA